MLFIPALFRAPRKSHVKLLARDVHGLGTIEGIDDSHVLHGKVIHRVEVAGAIVNIKPGQTKSFGSYGAVNTVTTIAVSTLLLTTYSHLNPLLIK